MVEKLKADEMERLVAEERERQEQRIAQRTAARQANFERLASDPIAVRRFHEIGREAIDAFNELGEQFIREMRRCLK